MARGFLYLAVVMDWYSRYVHHISSHRLVESVLELLLGSKPLH
jgi:hypothetical protein